MKIKNLIYKIWYLLTYRFISPKLKILDAKFSGDGSFIDVRYWLSRPDKIAPKTHPFLLTSQNQTLGLMHLSKFGVIQSKVRKHTNTGILLFYNKNKTIKSENKVILSWDNLKSDDFVVI